MKDQYGQDNRPLAIPFVLTFNDRWLDTSKLSSDDVTKHRYTPRAYRCGCCEDRVDGRGGFIRRLHFTHRSAAVNSRPCPWRTEGISRHFDGRNPGGDDGKWHIDAAMEMLSILTGPMQLQATRNDYVAAVSGVRKPDIAFSLDGQRIHFEIQSSPTSAASMTQRSERDFEEQISTIWIINGATYAREQEAGTLPAWVDNLATFCGGQIWLWDRECYERSCVEGSLWLKRVCSNGVIEAVGFREVMPITCCAKIVLKGNKRMTLNLCLVTRDLPLLDANRCHLLDEFREPLENIAMARNHPYQYGYADIRINVPVPSYRLAEDVNLTVARERFDKAVRQGSSLG